MKSIEIAISEHAPFSLDCIKNKVIATMKGHILFYNRI